jgi:hypothetical protein
MKCTRKRAYHCPPIPPTCTEDALPGTKLCAYHSITTPEQDRLRAVMDGLKVGTAKPHTPPKLTQWLCKKLDSLFIGENIQN